MFVGDQSNRKNYPAAQTTLLEVFDNDVQKKERQKRMMRHTMSSALVFVTILLLVICCFGQILAINVDGLLDIPNGEMASNFQVTLNRGEYTTLSKTDGAFSFYNVPNGIYLLDVLSVHHVRLTTNHPPFFSYHLLLTLSR